MTVDRLGAAARRSLGFGFVPEERLGRGTVPAMSLADNALLTGWRAGMTRLRFCPKQSSARIRTGHHSRFQGQGRQRAVARGKSFGRQPTKIHRRPRDTPGTESAVCGTTHLGSRRRCCLIDPPSTDRAAQRGCRRAGDLRGARRTVQHLRQNRRAQRRPAVACAAAVAAFDRSSGFADGQRRHSTHKHHSRRCRACLNSPGGSKSVPLPRVSCR